MAPEPHFLPPRGLLRLLPILPWLNKGRLKALRVSSVLACAAVAVLALYEVFLSYLDGSGQIIFLPLLLAFACLSKLLDPVASVTRSQAIGRAALQLPEVQRHLDAAFASRRGLVELDYAVIKQFQKCRGGGGRPV